MHSQERKVLNLHFARCLCQHLSKHIPSTHSLIISLFARFIISLLFDLFCMFGGNWILFLSFCLKHRPIRRRRDFWRQNLKCEFPLVFVYKQQAVCRSFRINVLMPPIITWKQVQNRQGVQKNWIPPPNGIGYPVFYKTGFGSWNSIAWLENFAGRLEQYQDKLREGHQKYCLQFISTTPKP